MARNRNIIRTEAVYRRLMLRFFHSRWRLLLVTEYPKSGASWLAQMLAEGLDIPFPRQTFPPVGQAIYHGHYVGIKPKGPTVVFWRDPRDIAVSWYHHCLIQSDRNHPEFVAANRRRLNFEDVEDLKSNLPEFITFMFGPESAPKFTFNEFFDYWHGREGVIESSYEKLSENTGNELMRIFDELDIQKKELKDIESLVERFSFKSQSGRNSGDENAKSYLRKGIIGDWENWFSPEASELIEGHLGSRLEALGYAGKKVL